MADAIVILIILAAVTAAITYIIKAKKRGVKCIGCSAADTCGSAGNPQVSCSACGDIDEIVLQIKRDSQNEKK